MKHLQQLKQLLLKEAERAQNKIIVNLHIIALIVILGLLLLFKGCNSGNNSEDKRVNPIISDTTITYVQVIGDTVYLPSKRTVIYTTVWDTLIKPGDTITVVKQYNNTNIYQDSIQIDSFGQVLINDSIRWNRILSRNIKHNLQIPVTTIHTKELIPQRGTYLLGTINTNGIGGGIQYINKKEYLFGLSAGITVLNASINPYVGFSVGKKIR